MAELEVRRLRGHPEQHPAPVAVGDVEGVGAVGRRVARNGGERGAETRGGALGGVGEGRSRRDQLDRDGRREADRELGEQAPEELLVGGLVGTRPEPVQQAIAAVAEQDHVGPGGGVPQERGVRVEARPSHTAAAKEPECPASPASPRSR